MLFGIKGRKNRYPNASRACKGADVRALFSLPTSEGDSEPQRHFVHVGDSDCVGGVLAPDIYAVRSQIITHVMGMVVLLRTCGCFLVIEARGGRCICFRTPCPNFRAEPFKASAAAPRPRKRGRFRVAISDRPPSPPWDLRLPEIGTVRSMYAVRRCRHGGRLRTAYCVLKTSSFVAAV